MFVPPSFKLLPIIYDCFSFFCAQIAEVIYLLFVVSSFCRFVFSSFCRVPNCHILMAWGEHFCWRLLKQDVWLGKVNNVTFITSRRWKRIIFQNNLFQSYQGQIVNEPKSHHHKLLFWYGLKIFELNDFFGLRLSLPIKRLVHMMSSLKLCFSMRSFFHSLRGANLSIRKMSL